MTILDIDQDFFFYPTFYGGITSNYSKSKNVAFSEMKVVHTLEEVLKKFNIIQVLLGKIFINHNELYNELVGLRDLKIIHLDAHSDMYGCNEESANSVDESNFLLKMIEEGITNEIDWLRQDLASLHNEERAIENKSVHFGRKFVLKKFKFSDYAFTGQIDRLYYTLSPNFCPPNLLLVNQMKKMIR